MFIYNLTLQIEEGEIRALKKWVTTDLINRVESKSGLRHKNSFELMFDPNPGVTMALQFSTESENEINSFRENLKSLVEKMVHNKFGGRVVCFGTFLKSVKN